MDYTVQSGDTLSKIARDVLGDVGLWKEIAIRNGIQGPGYVIEPGQVLHLTDDNPQAVRSVKPGLTITAPVPDGARQPMPAWQSMLLWGGVFGIAAMFLFPPKPGNAFGLKRKTKRKKSRARVRRRYA